MKAKVLCNHLYSTPQLYHNLHTRKSTYRVSFLNNFIYTGATIRRFGQET